MTTEQDPEETALRTVLSPKRVRARIGHETSVQYGCSAPTDGDVSPAAAPVRIIGHPGATTEAERERLASGFGAELLRLRKASHLSQERTASLTGVSQPYLSRLERGLRRPTEDAIVALARVLAPVGTADDTAEHLATLAGESLREGAARKRRRRENKHRREAAREMARVIGKAKSQLAMYRARGWIPHPALVEVAESDVLARLDPIPEDPKPLGATPRRGPSRDPVAETHALIRDLLRQHRTGAR